MPCFPFRSSAHAGRPTHAAHRVHESLARRAAKQVCSIFLTLLLIAGVVVFVIWLAIRPHRPRFHVSSFTVPGLVTGSPIFFNVSDRNPNREIGIHYDSVDVSVYYQDQLVGVAQGVVGPFYQPPKSTTLITGKTVAKEGWAVVEEDAGDGQVWFRMELRSAIRFKLSTWDTHRHPLHVSCDVQVGPDGAILEESRERRCSLYFF